CVKYLLERYPEAHNQAALNEMARSNPQRFSDYQRDYANTETGLNYLGTNLVRAAQYDQAVAAQHQAQAFQHQAQAWDRQFEAAHKSEFTNRQYATRVSQEIVAALKEAGASDQDIAMGYGAGQGPLGNIRTPVAQEALWAMGKQRLAQRNMREG